MANKDKQNVEELNQVLSVGEQWFIKYGEVNAEGHKQLKRLLSDSIPKAARIEYFVDTEARTVDVVVYLKRWASLFSNPTNLAENVLELLKECLSDYEITVQVKRNQ